LTIEESSSQSQQSQSAQQQPRIYDVTDGVKSVYTKRNYRSTFNHFTSTIFENKNPDLRLLLDYKPSVIESKIIDYIEYLKTRKLAYSTVQGYCASIFHFFEINDVNLNTRKIKRFLPQDEFENISNDRPYSVNEIEQILSKCDIRSRVVILLMASTGMRIGGLRELRLADIKKIDEFGLYMIWVYNRSRKDRYYTFCTIECAVAIDAYLDYRRSFGEELKDKSPLIREQFNIDNPFTAKAPRFLSPRMMSFVIEDVLKRSGINQIRVGNERRDVMCTHGFRKYFITQCDKAHMAFTVREYLSGHRLPNQDASYIRTTEEDRLAEYVKVIPFLTIDETQRLQDKVKDLEGQQAQEIERLKTQLKGYEVEQARAIKQSHDISNQALEELRARIEATEDKYERAIVNAEYLQKFAIWDRDRRKKELEAMSPRMRKRQLEEEKIWDEWYKKNKANETSESFAEYYLRRMKRRTN
jgi:integrase